MSNESRRNKFMHKKEKTRFYCECLLHGEYVLGTAKSH